MGTRIPWMALTTCALLALAACGGGDTTYSGGGSGNANNDGNNDVNNDPNNDFPNNDGNNDVNNDPNNDPNNDAPDAGGPNNDNPDDPDGGDVTPDSPTLGGGCLGDPDCSLGELCVGANPQFGVEGYCTVLDCTSHEECEFAQGGTFCCSDFGQYRGCFREAEGATCGDGDGQQNDPCVEGGQSDCQGDAFFCAAFYGPDTAICMEGCVPGRGGCEPGTACYQTQPGYGICTPVGDTPTGESCREDPFSCQPGHFCLSSVEDDPHAWCAELCSSNRDCDPDQWCQIYPGQGGGICQTIGQTEEGQSCTEDRFGCDEDLYCLYEGTRYATCTSLCRRQADCDREAGFICQFYDLQNSLGVCTQPGDRQTGEACGDDPLACAEGAFCVNGYGEFYNPEAYCVDQCQSDANCGEGFYCQQFPGGSFCQPDGPQQPGDVCESPLECARDSYCIQGEDDARFCAGLCTADADCAQGEYCTGDAQTPGVCYPFGDLEPGDSCEGRELDCGQGAFCAGPEPVCISQCTDAPDSCPDGMYCLEPNANGQRFCYPEGQTEGYERCEGAYDCEAGFFCLGQGQERRCLPGCGTDDDCAQGYWCFRSRTWSQCIRDVGGTTGESCAQTDGCAEDHLCLYAETEQAICAQDCTGFNQRCGDGEVCRYFGFGLNLCHPVGDGGVGAPCAEDPTVCDGQTQCVGVGQPGAFCAQLCSFDPGVCPEGTECVFSPGGLGTCLPPDFDPQVPIDGGGPL